MNYEKSDLIQKYYIEPVRQIPEERYVIQEQLIIDSIIHTLVIDTITKRYTHYRIPHDMRSRLFTIEKIMTHTAAPLHIAKEIFGHRYNLDVSNYRG